MGSDIAIFDHAAQDGVLAGGGAFGIRAVGRKASRGSREASEKSSFGKV